MACVTCEFVNSTFLCPGVWFGILGSLQISQLHNVLSSTSSGEKTKEWELIQTIARNNKFLHKLNRQIQHKIDHTQTEEKDKKIWTTFTYHSPKIRKIINLFKHTNIHVDFKNATTLHQLTKPKMPNQTPGHKKVEFTNSHVTHAIDHT